MELTNGVTSIKGEIHSMITLIRLNTRWSSRYIRKSGKEVNIYEEEDIFIQKFRVLNEYLEGLFDMRDIDCGRYIAPFHDIVISDQASGTLTRAALSSLNKFALYGFFQPEFPGIEEAMVLIGKSVSHCVFEETDWESDELILMKLLELASSSFRCNASHLLTVETAWDIYSTCVSIHNHYRASKILRTEAETALVHVTLCLFSKASSMIAKQGEAFSEEIKGKNFQNENSSSSIPSEFALSELKLSDATGITLLLLKILTVINNLLDLPKQQKSSIKFGLFLTNVALEAGGTSLNTIHPLVHVLRNDICRHLLRATQSDDLGIFSSSLRVVFNLFMSIKDHIKIQLEVFLTSVHLRLLSQTSSIIPAKEELVLESLVEFCREPALMQDLYTNYDCDVQCTNLFDSIISTLYQRSTLELNGEFFTNSALQTSDGSTRIRLPQSRLTILHRLAFEGLYAILHSLTTKLNDVVHMDSFDLENELKDALETEIDKWCETQSDSEFLLQEDEEVVVDESIPRTKEVGNSSDNEGGKNPPVKETKNITPIDPWVRVNVPVAPGNSDQLSLGSGSEHSESNNPSIVDRENELTTNLLSDGRTSAKTEALRKKRKMKLKIKTIAEQFNAKPLKTDWIKSAYEAGFIETAESISADAVTYFESFDPKSVAEFLKMTPGLGKPQIGEFISKGPAHLFPFHAQVLKEYVGTFCFEGENKEFDKALRLFLGYFRLPGEAQCIDRIMEAFAGRYFESLDAGKPFASADAVFILSFSTIMLNTDLHNPQIAANKKMTKEEFIKNNRGINDGKDLPRDYLEAVYNEIKGKQIQVDVDMNDNNKNLIDFTDPANWNKLLLRDTSNSWEPTAANFTPTATARKRQHRKSQSIMQFPKEELMFQQKLDAWQNVTCETDMFMVLSKRLFEVLIILWENVVDDYFVHRLMQCTVEYLYVCYNLKLKSVFESAIRVLLLLANRLIIQCREIDAIKSFSKNKFMLRRSLYEEWIRETHHRLEPLVESSLDQLFYKADSFHSIALKSGSGEMKHLEGSESPAIDWTEAVAIKGELLLKIALESIMQCNYPIHKEIWSLLFQYVLLFRQRGSLNKDLTLIPHHFVLKSINSESVETVVAKVPISTVYGYCCFFQENSKLFAMLGIHSFPWLRKSQSITLKLEKQNHSDGDGSRGNGWWGIFGFGGSSNENNYNVERGDDESQSALPRHDLQPFHRYSAFSQQQERLADGDGEDVEDLLYNLVCYDYLEVLNCKEKESASIKGLQIIPYRTDDYLSKQMLKYDHLKSFFLEQFQAMNVKKPDALFVGLLEQLNSTVLSLLVGKDHEFDILTVFANQRGHSAANYSLNRSVQQRSNRPHLVDLMNGVIPPPINKPDEAESANQDEIFVLDLFPLQLLSTSFSYPKTSPGYKQAASSEKRQVSPHQQLDAVLLLDLLCSLVYESEAHWHYFGFKVYQLLSYFLSEEYDTLFCHLPFFLERVIYHSINGILKAMQMFTEQQQAVKSLSTPRHKARSSSRSNTPPPNRVSYFHVPINNTTENSSGSTLPSDRHIYSILFQQYWNLIKLLRDLPSEYLMYCSHLLHSGVMIILKAIQQFSVELSLEQLYNLFSLLSMLLLLPPPSTEWSAGDDGSFDFPAYRQIQEVLSVDYQQYYLQQSRISLWKSLSLLMSIEILNYSNSHLLKHLFMKFLQSRLSLHHQREYAKSKPLFLSSTILMNCLEGEKKERFTASSSEAEINELSIALIYNLELMLMIIVDYIRAKGHAITKASIKSLKSSSTDHTEARTIPKKSQASGTVLQSLSGDEQIFKVSFPVAHYLYQFIEKIEMIFDLQLQHRENQSLPSLSAAPETLSSSLFFNRNSLIMKGINFQKIDEIEMMWLNTCFTLTDCLLENPSMINTGSIPAVPIERDENVPINSANPTDHVSIFNDYFNFQFLQCNILSIETLLAAGKIAAFPLASWFNIFNEFILTQRFLPMNLLAMLKQPSMMNCFRKGKEHPFNYIHGAIRGRVNEPDENDRAGHSSKLEFHLDFYDYYSLFETNRYSCNIIFQLFFGYFKDIKHLYYQSDEDSKINSNQAVPPALKSPSKDQVIMADAKSEGDGSTTESRISDEIFESFYDLYQHFIQILLINSNIVFNFLLRHDSVFAHFSRNQSSRITHEKADFLRVYEEMIMMIIALLRSLKLPLPETTISSSRIDSNPINSTIAENRQSRTQQPATDAANTVTTTAKTERPAPVLFGIMSWFNSFTNPPNTASVNVLNPIVRDVKDSNHLQTISVSVNANATVSDYSMTEQQYFDLTVFMKIWKGVQKLNPQFLQIIKQRDPTFFKIVQYALENHLKYFESYQLLQDSKKKINSYGKQNESRKVSTTFTSPPLPELRPSIKLDERVAEKRNVLTDSVANEHGKELEIEANIAVTSHKEGNSKNQTKQFDEKKEVSAKSPLLNSVDEQNNNITGVQKTAVTAPQRSTSTKLSDPIKTQNISAISTSGSTTAMPRSKHSTSTLIQIV